VQPFPDIAGAQHWYVTTKDGLIGLRMAADHAARLSDATLDQLWGMTEAEWHQFYSQQATRHEMFATLALFAACEGGIRRDFEWRCLGNHGQEHRQKFSKLKRGATRKHIPLNAILDTWQSADNQKKWFANQIATLKSLLSSAMIWPTAKRVSMLHSSWFSIGSTPFAKNGPKLPRTSVAIDCQHGKPMAPSL